MVFTKNRQFGAKSDWNSIFLGRDPHIIDQLSITVPYMNFYGFWKSSNFRSKCIGVSLRFYRKSPVWDKNWSKLRISWSWPHIGDWLYITVPYMSFYGFRKNSKFHSKSIGVSQLFYRKSPVSVSNWSKPHIFWSWPHIADRLSITIPIWVFMGFKKIQSFVQNP
jgi:hypothetical protein